MPMEYLRPPEAEMDGISAPVILSSYAEVRH